MAKQRRKLEDLTPAPIRHRELPPALVARIDWIRLTLDEVYPQSMAEWLDGFQRDTNPEHEVVWWEWLAHCYVEYSEGQEVSPAQKQAAFRVMMKLALGSAEEANVDLPDLPAGGLEEILRIMGRWWQGPGPSGTGPDIIQ
jgi:hypothetical protein